jgi:branched-chain amino acid transport system permease protein
MATATPTPTAPVTDVSAPPPTDYRRALRVGGLGALALAFVSTIGMVATFDRRVLIVGLLTMGTAIYYAVPLVTGTIAATRPAPFGKDPQRSRPTDVLAAALAGAVVALGPAVLIAGLRSGADLRATFPNLSPALLDLLTGERAGVTAYVVLLATMVALSAIGGAFRLLPDQLRRAVSVGIQVVLVLSLIELIARQFLGNLGLSQVHRTVYVTNAGLRAVPALAILVVTAALAYRYAGRRATARERMLEADAEPRRRSLLWFGVVAVTMGVLPMLVGGVVNEMLVNVGLFMLMALGLNIIVGYAGLLDLGHVTFFAVGSYGMAVLTSPASPGFAPALSWWVALPLVVALAAVAGVLVGTPVIRLRGDYLAIVTLGFAAILERLFISDWLRPYFCGAQGIRRIPGVDVGTTVIRGGDPRGMLYLTMAFVVIAVYVSWRLQGSRVGRAWAALREDETTAEAMGIDTTKAKLMAFVSGAMLASFAGALFAAKVGTVFPNSFELLVSIVILVVVIVGGMGHIPGVLVGAVVLIGVLGGPRLPGLLQEFEDYKMLVYGALLVYMMLQRPEGLVPSVRRSRELHQDEFLQDAWLDKKAAADPDLPADATFAEAAMVESADGDGAEADDGPAASDGSDA